MKTNNNLTVVVLCLGGFLLFNSLGEKKKPDVIVPDSSNVAVAESVMKEYIQTVANGFNEVGQASLNGKYKNTTEAAADLAEKNEEALEKYIKINELLNTVNGEDMKAFGKLSLEVSKGVRQVVAP